MYYFSKVTSLQKVKTLFQLLFPYYVTSVFSFISKTVPIQNMNIYQHKMGPGLDKTPSTGEIDKPHET